MSYIGDFALGSTFDTKFTTVNTSGVPTTLAGTPVISAYPDNSTTELTAGITLTVDFDARTGMHNVRVVATSGNGYAAASNYQLVITTGTVGGSSVVGYVVAEFSIEARSPLRPTTSGRTLDVSVGGEAGLDWANIGSPTTAQNLSATNIDVDQVVASVSGAVGSVGAGGITAASIATGAIDADSLAADATTEIRSVASGTADSGTTTTMVDAARTEADTDYWKGCLILFTSGTLLGQCRLITAFTPGTDTITFAHATTIAVGTHTYEILPAGRADVQLWLGAVVNALIAGRVDSDVGAMQAGTVTASVIATNAIDADAIAADAVTEIQSGLATSAALATVQSDTDDIQTRLPATLVSGRIDASVGAMAANVVTAAAIATGAVDADALAADAVTEIRSVASGTSDSGTTTTMVDAARTESDADYWKGCFILFTSGTIAGQVRLITAFDPATDTITFSHATTQAVATQTYEILPAGRADLQLWLGSMVNALIAGRVDANVQAMAANIITSSVIATDAIGATQIAANAIGASELAADAVTEIQSGLATSVALATVQADTDDIQTRLPAALVGGRMDSSVGAMAANVLTASALASDTATEIRSLASGTSDSGTTTTMVDAARTEADVDYWKGQIILFTSGTLLGQAKLITAFDPATDTITFSPAATVAVGTQTYEILPMGRADVGLWLGSAPSALISGRVDANAQAMGTDVIGAAQIATDAIGSAELAASAVTEIQSGLATSAVLATVQADTDDIQTRLPATLVGGRMDSSIGAMAASVVTAAAIATDAIDADALAADAVTEIQSGLATSANQTTILNRIGAFTGAGLNTILGFLRALARKDAALTPSDMAGTFDNTTDSLEAIKDNQLDAAISSRSSHTAADVWSSVTRLLTAGTNIVLAKGVGVTGFNDLSAAQVNAEVVDGLNVDTYPEPGQGAPPATASLATKQNYIYKSWRNKKTQTSTTRSLYNDAETVVDQKATDADDVTTFTKGEMGTGP